MDSTVEVAAKDPTTDASKVFAALNQPASMYACKNTESIEAYIEKCSITAQTYLNYKSTDSSSVASQIPALKLI